VVAAFSLRLLAHEGVSPELDRCVVCSEDADRLFWSAEAGGVRCGSCGGGRVVSDESLSVTRAVLGGGLNAVLDLPESSKTHDVESMASEMLELHIERRLRSLRVVHDSE
jgi:DNA repair protein RecO (recombination protein O)